MLASNENRPSTGRENRKVEKDCAHATKNDPHEGLLLVLGEVTRTGRLLRITATIRLAIRLPAFFLFPYSLIRSVSSLRHSHPKLRSPIGLNPRAILHRFSLSLSLSLSICSVAIALVVSPSRAFYIPRHHHYH